MASLETTDGSLNARGADSSWPRRSVRIAALVIILATVTMHLPCVLFPMIWQDDFGLIRESWPWSVTRANLWLTHNEHCMPLGRLLTYVLVELAGSASALPLTTALLGPAALVIALAAIYWFVRREMGHPFYALFAMAFFGLSSQYAQTVYWFSAALFLVAFDFALFGLLAAQRWSQTGKTLPLILCSLFTALAPTWNAIGLLAGPLCALYLVVTPPENRCARRLPWVWRLLWACAPLLGTGLFLAVSLPFTADRIMHVGHYGDKTALESFQLGAGIVNALRSLVDNQVIGTFGLSRAFTPPRILTFILLAPLLVAGVLWWRLATHRRLLAVGMGIILCNYLLVYGARADWAYERIRIWGRYHLFPHFGWVLFIVGGLPHWRERLIGKEDRPPRWLRKWWVPILLLLLLAHCWVNGSGVIRYDPKQRAQLQQIDAMGRRCREHRIGREQALRVLPPFAIVGSSQEFDNCWKLMRCSDNPREMTDDEAARLLLGVLVRLRLSSPTR